MEEDKALVPDVVEKADWECPKFWRKEIKLSERTVQKMDPRLFVKAVEPFMAEFGKAIIAARSSGKEFKIVSYIMFPQYVQLGAEKKLEEPKVG